MDRVLDPVGDGDFFATRVWIEAVLAGALAADAQPVLALDEDQHMADAALPLMVHAHRLRSLTTPYSLSWRPLFAAGIDAGRQVQASARLGRQLRSRSPLVLELLDAGDARVGHFCDGLRSAGLCLSRFDHVGNWHEALPPDAGWDAYLAARPPALRSTIARKTARATRMLAFEEVSVAGEALEAGIAAYEHVRAQSWKPDEPFPDFDGSLLRAVAPAGVLRLGILRRRQDGVPVAAQYWILDRPGGPGTPRRATVLKLAHLQSERAASPGTVLTAMMIRGLLEKDGVRILDFGRGDDAYKQLWAGTRRQRIGLVVADPWRPSGMIALGRQALGRLRRRLRGG